MQEYCFLLNLRHFHKNGHCSNLIFRAANTFWTPRSGTPQFSTWMFVSSFLPFVVSWFVANFWSSWVRSDRHIATPKTDCRSNVWIRPPLWKQDSKWPCPKRKAVEQFSDIICEKAPCTDLQSDPTLHQNSYRTTQADAYVNHAHQTQAQRV